MVDRLRRADCRTIASLPIPPSGACSHIHRAGECLWRARRQITNKCTRVADRAFLRSKVTWRQPGDLCRSPRIGVRLRNNDDSFSEPFLLLTVGGRFIWFFRVIRFLGWIAVVLLVLVGIGKPTLQVSSVFNLKVVLSVSFYAIASHLGPRKIIARPNCLLLKSFAVTSGKNVSLSISNPLLIVDSTKSPGLHMIQLMGVDVNFSIYLEEDEANRLASWARENLQTVSYRNIS